MKIVIKYSVIDITEYSCDITTYIQHGTKVGENT
jgi:hypothetical protein